jgi:hypothetical protein
MKNHQMGDAERDLRTVQGGQALALRPFPLPLPSTRLILALFEVMEATGNFTEAALKGGGFYSPEGFPFQKHVTSKSSAWARPALA